MCASVVAAGLWLLMLAGCVPHPSAPAVLPPATPATLLRRLERDAQAFRSLKGAAKVEVTRAGKSFSVTQALFAQEPDHLRAEALNFFGQPVWLMATNGTELSVLALSEGKFYQGAATPANLQRILRLPLSLPALVSFLLYRVPLIDHDRQGLLSGEKDGYLLSLQGGEGRRQRLRFDGKLRLVETDYFAGSHLLLQVTYGSFTSQDGRFFPQRVSLKIPPAKTEATVVFSDVRTNVPISESRFTLTPPAGVRVLPLP